MKKIIFFAILILTVFQSSCDIFEDITGTGDECMVVKSSFDIPNDPARGETEYNYDSNDRLIEIISSDWDRDPDPYISRYKIDYSGDLVDKISYYTTFMNDPEEIQMEHRFFYTGQNIDSIWFEGHNAFVNSDGYYLIDYNGSKISSIQRHNYLSFNGSFDHHSTVDLEWTGDNVSVAYVDLIATTDTFRHVYTYDSMKRTYALPGFSLISGQYYGLSANNIIKDEYYLSSNIIDNDDFAYTYNDKGYPATSQQLPNYPLYNHEYDCK